MQPLDNREHTGPIYVAGQVLVKTWDMTTKGPDSPWQVLAPKDYCTLGHRSTKAKSRLNGSRQEWLHRYLRLSNSVFIHLKCLPLQSLVLGNVWVCVFGSPTLELLTYPLETHM